MKISFSQFRNQNYVFLIVELINILKAIATEKLEVLGLHTYLASAQERLPNINLALDKNMKNPYTDLLDEQDELRDRAIDSLKYYLLHCINEPNAEMVAAAQRIIEILRTHGWSMQNEGYDEQSKQERSFIVEIEQRNNLMDDVTTIKALDIFNRVKSSQLDFEQTRRSFLSAETNIKEISPQVEKAWIRDFTNKVILALNFHYMNQTSPEAMTIYNQFKTVIEKIDQDKKARSTRSKTEAEQAGSNGSPE